MIARLGLLALFFLSGAAGLVLEVVWMRRLHLLFGSTALATAAVTAAFMAGLGLGAWLAARRGDQVARPLRWYGALELGIAGYALAIPLLLSACLPVYRGLAGVFGGAPVALDLLRFSLAFLVLAPATTAMGATLPLLVRHLAAHTAVGRATGALYSANTAGALVGVLAGGYVLLPHLGESTSTWLAVTLDLVVGVGALAWAVRAPAVSAAEQTDPPSIPREAWWLLGGVGVAGFAALACQVAWTRLVALVLGSSVYAFTCIVASVLAGIAMGSAVVGWLPPAAPERKGRALALAMAVAAVSALLGTAMVEQGIFQVFRWTYMHGASAYWLIQLGTAALFILPPSIAFGALPPLAVRALAPSPEVASRWVGRVWISNTVGALLGAALGGLALLPAVGMQWTLVLAGGMVIAAGVALLMRERSRLAWGVAPVGTLVLLWAGALPHWEPALLVSQPYVEAARLLDRDATSYRDLEDYRLWMGQAYHRALFHREGASATVTVMADPSHLVLHTDGKPDASSVLDMDTQLLLGHIPMLLHPAPRSALVIGLGSGVSVGAVARHPDVAVTCVEIEPAVTEAAVFFAHAGGNPLSRPNVRVVAEDARTLLVADATAYDVIVSEPSNPWLSGPAKLFTREFFESVRARLKPGGIFGQWVHLYGLEPQYFLAILRTFRATFPDVRVFQTIPEADLLLVGGTGTGAIDWATVGARAAQPGIAGDLAAIQTEGAAGICSRYLAGPEEARQLAGEGVLNTDDNGFVEYGAGWTGWRKNVAKDLSQEIETLTPDPLPLLGSAPPGGLAAALSAMGASCLARQESRAAAHWAERSLDCAPTAEGYRVRGLALDRMGGTLGAEEAFQAGLALEPRSVPLRRAYGESLLDSGDFALAAEILLAEEVDDPVCRCLGASALQLNGRAAEAYAVFRQLPLDVFDRVRPQARALAGGAAMGAGAWKQAVALLEQHLVRSPTDLTAAHALREALEKSGRRSDAARLGRTLVGLREERQVIANALDSIEEVSPELVPVLREAVQRDPMDPLLLARLCKCLRIQGVRTRATASESYFEEALTLGRQGHERFPWHEHLAAEHAYLCELLAARSTETAQRSALADEGARTLRSFLASNPPDLSPLDRAEFEGRAIRLSRMAR